MMANSWLYQYYGYQNQPCSMLDPRCQKFFRRDQCYQETYQEPYQYMENQEVEYPGYHVSSYVQQKPEEYSGCERVYSDRGPVDYSTHSPQSTISEERSVLTFFFYSFHLQQLDIYLALGSPNRFRQQGRPSSYG